MMECYSAAKSIKLNLYVAMWISFKIVVNELQFLVSVKQTTKYVKKKNPTYKRTSFILCVCVFLFNDLKGNTWNLQSWLLFEDGGEIRLRVPSQRYL